MEMYIAGHPGVLGGCVRSVLRGAWCARVAGIRLVAVTDGGGHLFPFYGCEADADYHAS